MYISFVFLAHRPLLLLSAHGRRQPQQQRLGTNEALGAAVHSDHNNGTEITAQPITKSSTGYDCSMAWPTTTTTKTEGNSGRSNDTSTPPFSAHRNTQHSFQSPLTLSILDGDVAISADLFLGLALIDGGTVCGRMSCDAWIGLV